MNKTFDSTDHVGKIAILEFLSEEKIATSFTSNESIKKYLATRYPQYYEKFLLIHHSGEINLSCYLSKVKKEKDEVIIDVIRLEYHHGGDGMCDRPFYHKWRCPAVFDGMTLEIPLHLIEGICPSVGTPVKL